MSWVQSKAKSLKRIQRYVTHLRPEARLRDRSGFNILKPQSDGHSDFNGIRCWKNSRQSWTQKGKKGGGKRDLRSIPTALMIDCISEQPYPDAALHKLINSRRKRAGPMILIMQQRVLAKAVTSSRNKNSGDRAWENIEEHFHPCSHLDFSNPTLQSSLVHILIYFHCKIKTSSS